LPPIIYCRLFDEAVTRGRKWLGSMLLCHLLNAVEDDTFLYIKGNARTIRRDFIPSTVSLKNGASVQESDA